jgi:1-acyl-sn-glycerol-3-phosphate acyltransferase
MYLLSAIRLITCLLLAVLFILYYTISLLFRKHQQEKAFNLRRNWAYVIFWILGIKIESTGNIPEKPVLFVCNHRSMMDPLILSSFIKAFIIAKAEVFKYPLIGFGAKLTGVIFVKREKKKSRKDTRKALVDILKSGENVLVFPEGTTGIKRRTLAFRIGSFEELAKLGLPVIPIAMEYKNRADLWLKPNMAVQLLVQFAKWRTYVKVAFGDPIISNDSMELHDKSKAFINAHLEEMQSAWHEVFHI